MCTISTTPPRDVYSVVKDDVSALRKLIHLQEDPWEYISIEVRGSGAAPEGLYVFATRLLYLLMDPPLISALSLELLKPRSAFYNVTLDPGACPGIRDQHNSTQRDQAIIGMYTKLRSIIDPLGDAEFLGFRDMSRGHDSDAFAVVFGIDALTKI